MRADVNTVIAARTTELSGAAKVAEIARLLESAMNRYNESAEAACVIARRLGQGDKLDDTMFETIFHTVTNLALVSLDRKPDYRRAARELVANLTQRTAREVSRESASRK